MRSLQTFERAQRGTRIVRSVTLLHRRWGEVSPLSLSDSALGEPRRTDVPTPHNNLIQRWARQTDLDGRTTTTASNVAEFFVFENVMSATKLELFVWTLEQVVREEALTALHYAFLLHVFDM